jgi:hypothetical protein
MGERAVGRGRGAAARHGPPAAADKLWAGRELTEGNQANGANEVASTTVTPRGGSGALGPAL